MHNFLSILTGKNFHNLFFLLQEFYCIDDKLKLKTHSPCCIFWSAWAHDQSQLHGSFLKGRGGEVPWNKVGEAAVCVL